MFTQMTTNMSERITYRANNVSNYVIVSGPGSGDPADRLTVACKIG